MEIKNIFLDLSGNQKVRKMNTVHIFKGDSLGVRITTCPVAASVLSAVLKESNVEASVFGGITVVNITRNGKLFEGDMQLSKFDFMHFNGEFTYGGGSPEIEEVEYSTDKVEEISEYRFSAGDRKELRQIIENAIYEKYHDELYQEWIDGAEDEHYDLMTDDRY